MANLEVLSEQNSILRVGEVISVDGRRISVRVDKNKNLTDLFFAGRIIKNISVNSFIEIRKGFLTIIGKVDGERIQEDIHQSKNFDKNDKNYRVLSISLSGYIDEGGKFVGGTKELPLIGNEAFILTAEKIHTIHNIAADGGDSKTIEIAKSEQDGIPIKFPIDGLFNSHIAIFGNTGSGKSNTLAALYQNLVNVLRTQNQDNFNSNCHFVLIDFNGEYSSQWFSDNVKICRLSTNDDNGLDKLVIKQDDLFNIETFSILVDATDKTQKPFLKRAIKYYERVIQVQDKEEYLKNIIRRHILSILTLPDKINTSLLLDYVKEILPVCVDEQGEEVDIIGDLHWFNSSNEFIFTGYVQNDPAHPYIRVDRNNIAQTRIYKLVEKMQLSDNPIENIIKFLYIQLIGDVLSNRANNEHIAPVINRLKSRQKDISKLLQIKDKADFWADKNFVVVNLHKVNLDMKKMLPLLLAKKLYQEHKSYNNTKTLSIIIDEAHNILSTESTREAETWKDYRIETFNEIIKEGRKFGVFITISSQRPSDISPTIISQAHNYFIHRLINQEDLKTIAKSISYIDKISEESIPTLPVGTCIFSGIATQMPLKINITELPDTSKPKSGTIKFYDIIAN